MTDQLRYVGPKLPRRAALKALEEQAAQEKEKSTAATVDKEKQLIQPHFTTMGREGEDMELKPKITLELDGQEAAIIGSALLDQAARRRDETRARLNRLIATKVFEARKRHHEAAAAILTQRYFGEG